MIRRQEIARVALKPAHRLVARVEQLNGGPRASEHFKGLNTNWRNSVSAQRPAAVTSESETTCASSRAITRFSSVRRDQLRIPSIEAEFTWRLSQVRAALQRRTARLQGLESDIAFAQKLQLRCRRSSSHQQVGVGFPSRCSRVGWVSTRPKGADSPARSSAERCHLGIDRSLSPRTSCGRTPRLYQRMIAQASSRSPADLRSKRAPGGTDCHS